MNYLDKLAENGSKVITVEQLWKIYDRHQLKLDPNYQREKVWPDIYKSKLITSKPSFG